jgi:hypothetical protein
MCHEDGAGELACGGAFCHEPVEATAWQQIPAMGGRRAGRDKQAGRHRAQQTEN